LQEEEIATAERVVTEIFASQGRPQPAKEGEQSICLLLALPSNTREGRSPVRSLRQATNGKPGERTECVE
jgi:hypothetical protein